MRAKEFFRAYRDGIAMTFDALLSYLPDAVKYESSIGKNLLAKAALVPLNVSRIERLGMSFGNYTALALTPTILAPAGYAVFDFVKSRL